MCTSPVHALVCTACFAACILGVQISFRSLFGVWSLSRSVWDSALAACYHSSSGVLGLLTVNEMLCSSLVLFLTSTSLNVIFVVFVEVVRLDDEFIADVKDCISWVLVLMSNRFCLFSDLCDLVSLDEDLD